MPGLVAVAVGTSREDHSARERGGCMCVCVVFESRASACVLVSFSCFSFSPLRCCCSLVVLVVVSDGMSARVCAWAKGERKGVINGLSTIVGLILRFNRDSRCI